MIAEHLELYKKWFKDYARSFLGGSETDDNNIQIKIDHTRRVCDEITFLSRSLGLDKDDIAQAQICALFHDVGRFEQYKRHGTYADHQSEDHAQLGVTILRQQKVLANLPAAQRELIIRVIACHNLARLPDDLDERTCFFARLLRDADKLDIWRVVVAYYREREHKPNTVIELNLPDTPGLSAGVLNDLRAGRFVDRRHIRNLNDFKLLQVGWIYDLNFPATYRLVKERNYLGSILGHITDGPELAKVRALITAFLEEKTRHQ